MELKANGKKVILVQVSDINNDSDVGLYLVPEGVDIDDFEQEIQKAEDQDDFDMNNNLGVQRIFACESKVDTNF